MRTEFEAFLTNVEKVNILQTQISYLENEQRRLDSLIDQTHGDTEIEETFIELSNICDRKIKAFKYKLAKLNLEIAKFEYEESIRD